jgi:hypothetical protein
MSCGAVITVNMWWFGAVGRVLPCSRTTCKQLSCRVRAYCRLFALFGRG